MKQVLVKHSDLNQRALDKITRLAEQIRNTAEGIYNYMDGEAELDMDTVDTFRIECGDLGDLAHELKIELDVMATPYRAEMIKAFEYNRWMENEKNDPDMDGRC